MAADVDVLPSIDQTSELHEELSEISGTAVLHIQITDEVTRLQAKMIEILLSIINLQLVSAWAVSFSW